MIRRWKIALSGITLAIAPLSACASAPRGERIYVREGPPPERREVIVGRPGSDCVFIRGHWVHGPNGGYGWMPGRWVRPESRLNRWEEGRWVHDRGGWYYIEGHWR
ncbi:MAG: hypothetical protein ABI889_00970 [Gemmatimonadota bacterium]